jgi:hypothetical protein
MNRLLLTVAAIGVAVALFLTSARTLATYFSRDSVARSPSGRWSSTTKPGAKIAASRSQFRAASASKKRMLACQSAAYGARAVLPQLRQFMANSRSYDTSLWLPDTPRQGVIGGGRRVVVAQRERGTSWHGLTALCYL